MIKLSQRDEENKIKVGDILEWISYDGSYLNKHDLVEVIKLNGGGFDFKLIKTSNSYSKIGQIFKDWFLSGFKLYEKHKEHEYSPVQMTGRYRTIGD